MVAKNDCVHCEDVGVQDAPGEGEVQAIAQELAELPKARIAPHLQATQEKTEPLSAAATAVTEVKARSSKPHLCGSLASQAQAASKQSEAKANPVERRMPWVLPPGGKLTVWSPDSKIQGLLRSSDLQVVMCVASLSCARQMLSGRPSSLESVRSKSPPKAVLQAAHRLLSCVQDRVAIRTCARL